MRPSRSAPPSAGSGRPTRTRSAAAPSAVVDLADIDALPAKIERVLTHHNALRRGLGIEEVNAEALLAELTAIAPKILPFADTVWSLLDDQRRAGKRILFEGAQGALLDVDHGTYPFVTSSNIVAAQAATGSGLGPARSATCWASPRRTRPGSARGRSPPSCTTRSARPSAPAGVSSASTRAASGAAAGSTPCWCARPCEPPASTASR